MDELTAAALRDEAMTASPERVNEIGYELARGGKTLVAPGSDEATRYGEALRAALADPAQIDALLFPNSH
jgi:hypothetical protein